MGQPYVGITISTRLVALCTVGLALIGLGFGVSPSAQEGENYVFNHNEIGHLWITQVTVWSDQSFENDPISISILDRSPTTTPSLPVSAYLEITAQGSTTYAEIDFKVPRTWLEQNHVGENDVVLLRLDGGWSELSTQQTDSSETYVYYSAQSPGLSVFAISGRATGQPQTLLGVLIVISGVVAASLIYWFLIRPRRTFTSLKRLEHEVGKEKHVPPPTEDRELPMKVKRLREATALKVPPPRAERLKTTRPRKLNAREDVALLKRLKKKTVEEEGRGK